MNRFGKEEEQLVLKSLRGGNISNYFKNPDGPPMIQELEREFADYIGTEYAVAVSSGTTALHAAYLACGIRPVDRVVVPAHTFLATASMVLAVGASPLFVDVDADTYCMNPKHLETILAKSATNATAVVPVDLLGYPAEMEAIYDIAKRKKMMVIEDAAQALGSENNRNSLMRKRVGSGFNDCATWSGQFTKSWTMGEGGMITTNDRKIYERCKSIRSHGSQYLNDPMLTFNFRATELSAAIGLAQLHKFPSILEDQQENAYYVMRHLPKEIKAPFVAPGVHPNWYIIGCKVSESFDRDAFVNACADARVSIGEPGSVVSKGYTQPLYEKALLRPYKPHGYTCENAEFLCHQWVWLDIHRFCTEKELVWRMKEINAIVQEIAGK